MLRMTLIMISLGLYALFMPACDGGSITDDDDQAVDTDSYTDTDTDSESDTGTGEECEFGYCELDLGGCLDEFVCCEELLDRMHDNPEEWCVAGKDSPCSCHPEDPCGLLNDGACSIGCDDEAGYEWPGYEYGHHWDTWDCWGY